MEEKRENRPEEAGREKPLHEINQYRDSAFPVAMFLVTKEKIVPPGRGYMDLHWHEDLQFTMVIRGTLTLLVNGTSYVVEEGQAIFINRNFLHITTGLTDGGTYVSFNFPDRMLGFFQGSRMEQKDVLPFTANYAFPAAVLKPEEEWSRRILQDLLRMRELYENPDCSFREYRLAMLITEIWYELISGSGEERKKSSRIAVRRQERVQRMLRYIHENYMNPIRLSEVAAAASVSEGECCRCFSEMVGKSPGQYLMNYRISRAMELLNGTDQSVTEVAYGTGFNDTSHFIHYFKRITGVTPKEYQKQKC